MARPMAEQVRLYALARDGDLAALADAHTTHHALLWTALIQDGPNQVFENRGTLLHWATWHRQWSVVSLAVAHGVDLSIRGEGCWMNGLTAAEYATKLDTAAGHVYYEHRKSFDKAAGADRADAVTAVVNATQKRVLLNAAPFSPEATLESDEVGIRLHDMVELSCIEGLGRALAKFGPAMGRAIVHFDPGPEGDPYDNRGTLAHWAVWYQNWTVLRWLRRHDCVALDVQGTGGGWLRGRTIEGYADLMDAKCQHPFYRHRVETAACLTATPVAAAAAAPGPAGAGGVEAAAGGADAAGTEERGANECAVCLTNQANHLIRPCNHLCVCRECGDALQAAHPPRCPICRGGIEAVERVFMN